MTPEELRRWSDEQVAVLVEAGIDPLDAQRSVRWVLERLPEGADPREWIPSIEQLDAPVDSEAALDDARADWFAKVPAKWARLLDAEEVRR